MENHNQDSLNRYLCFSLGHEEYGIPLLSVKEVIAMPEITPIPQTPAYYLGVMNLRGQIISIVDLRSRLGIKPLESPETAVIICDLKPNCIGIVVDAINSVLHPSPENLSENPDIKSQKSSEFITAIYKERDRLILLLDLDKAISMKELQKNTKPSVSK